MFVLQNSLRIQGAAAFFSSAALACFFAGCSTPTTGRVRDAHLLYGDDPAVRRIESAEQFGPFYEHVATAAGSERTSLRPFIYTKITAADGQAVHQEAVWPVYSSNRRDESLSWRFLTCFGADYDTADPESYSRLWAFPLWFQGQTKAGEDYAALFPVYGTIRNLYWDRIFFALFPLWVEYDRAGNHSWSFLWPIFSRTTGENADGFKVFPVYGQMEHIGNAKSRFVLWPIWTSAVFTNRNPGTSWMLFPVAGRVNRASESTWMVVPPFFTFSHGRDKLDYYRKINCPWPLVRIVDAKNLHKRYFMPFWGRQYDNDGKFDSRWVMWPFYRSRTAIRAGRRERIRSVFPVYHRAEVRKDGDKDGVFETELETYMRFWPLYSHRTDPDNSNIRIPDLSFSRRIWALDRNFLGMFTLYTCGSTENPRRVDHEVMWGLLRRGYGEAYSAFRVWPFYDSKADSDQWKWSVLGGLIGRNGDADGSDWRYLWFFGGPEDGNENKENSK